MKRTGQSYYKLTLILAGMSLQVFLHPACLKKSSPPAPRRIASRTSRPERKQPTRKPKMAIAYAREELCRYQVFKLRAILTRKSIPLLGELIPEEQALNATLKTAFRLKPRCHEKGV